MVLYGITGGLGMGKSTVAGLLSASGVEVLDVDDVAREITAAGGEAIPDIRKTFGDVVLTESGALDRQAVAALIFDNLAARKELEALLHPRIRGRWLGQVAEWRRCGVTSAAVVIPLLFETASENAFDHVVCVACSEGSQKARAGSRGWPPGQLEKRNRAQWPVAKKMDLAEFVLWNEGDATVLKTQLNRILALN